MKTDPEQEKRLINQCIQGSSEAWRHFVERYSSLVYYIIQRVKRSRAADMSNEEIGDLHNDVFLSMMEKNGRKLRQYEGKNGCSVSTWIRIITVRATIDYLRKKKIAGAYTYAVSDPGQDCGACQERGPEELLEHKEERFILNEIISQLAPRDQLFLRLLYYDGIAPRDIAAIFNSTTNAVYSRGNYLRNKMKIALKKKLSKKEK